MKTVAIISTITFAVIFGLIVLTSGLVGDLSRKETADIKVGNDQTANADRLFADLAAERDRVQRETERLLILRERLQSEEQTVQEHYQRVAAMVDTLAATQKTYGEERERSAQKLAKVYESMKPAQAAVILSGLELDVIMDVLGRMKDRQAAKIMAGMNAGLAAEISQRMSIKGERG